MAAQLTSNTGEGNGLFNLLNQVGDVAKTGAGIYATVTGKGQQMAQPAQTQAQPTAAPAGATDWKKYALWGGGGLAVLLVLYFMFKK